MRKTNTKSGSSAVLAAINAAILSHTERAEAVAAYTLGTVAADAIAALLGHGSTSKPAVLVTGRPALKA